MFRMSNPSNASFRLPMSRPAGIDVALTFDTTGSMYSYLERVRSKLRQIAAEIVATQPASRLAVVAYGDYCDQDYSYLVKHHPLTEDVGAIQRFVQTVEKTGGGDFPEAVEEALHAIRALDWQPSRPHIAILVGDAPPHGVVDSRDQCLHGHFYIDEAHALKAMNIAVYTVQCGLDEATTASFSAIAQITGGRHLFLDAIDELPVLLVAACKHRTGDLASYVKHLEKEGRVTGGLRRTLDRLKG
jgi:Mg-chelatase subunit ChlD